VSALGADGKVKALLRHTGLVGGVAGLAGGDLDGDGRPDLAAAVRLPGASRVDLWVLQ
jgi:hypothetical protein